MKRSHAAIVEPRPAGDRHNPPTHGLGTVDTDGTPEEDQGAHRGDGPGGHRTRKGSAAAGPLPAVLRGQEVTGVSQWVTQKAGQHALIRERWLHQRSKAKGLGERGSVEPLDSGVGPLWTVLR